MTREQPPHHPATRFAIRPPSVRTAIVPASCTAPRQTSAAWLADQPLSLLRRAASYCLCVATGPGVVCNQTFVHTETRQRNGRAGRKTRRQTPRFAGGPADCRRCCRRRPRCCRRPTTRDCCWRHTRDCLLPSTCGASRHGQAVDIGRWRKAGVMPLSKRLWGGQSLPTSTKSGPDHQQHAGCASKADHRLLRPPRGRRAAASPEGAAARPRAASAAPSCSGRGGAATGSASSAARAAAGHWTQLPHVSPLSAQPQGPSVPWTDPRKRLMADLSSDEEHLPSQRRAAPATSATDR